MSYAAAADELTTRVHPLNRSAIAGIAYRNGIKFTKKRSTPTPRKPKDRRTIPGTLDVRDFGAVANKSTFGSVAGCYAVRNVKAPGAACSWAACTDGAEPGDMFCRQHGKKQLVS